MKLSSRVQNSKGQIADIIMFIMFMSFVIYFIVSYTSMQVFFKTQNLVDEIIRAKVELVRTKGMFTEQDYADMIYHIGRYGAFDVRVTWESRENTGKKIIHYSYSDDSFNNEIKDKPMKVGDFIKIFAQSRKRPLFAEMLARNFLFGINKNAHTNFKMQSLSTGMVCTDGFIRGLEVINTIARYRADVPVGVKTYKYSDIANGIVDSSQVYNVPPSTYIDDSYPGYACYNSTIEYDPAEIDTWINPAGRFKETVTTDPDNYEITGIFIEELIGK